MRADFTFHHLGIACKSISDESEHYQALGYGFESPEFTDSLQGVRGRFLHLGGAPRIELLENLPASAVLDPFIERRTKIYHLAFLVHHLENAIDYLKKKGGRQISEPQLSSFFGSQICFFVMPNFQIVELIQAIHRGEQSTAKR